MATENLLIETSAPGKLMICGEWSILVPGNSCLVAAVDQQVHVRLQLSNKMFARLVQVDSGLNVEVPIVNGALQFESDSGDFSFLRSAVELCFRYFEKYYGFELETRADSLKIDSPSGPQKIGFGSSAAVTVATIGAFFALEGLDIEDLAVRLKIFKLAALAHYHAQSELGSGFDIAASTFGSLLKYTSFDPDWVLCELEHSTLKEIVERRWPGLECSPVFVPHDFQLLVGWSGSSANTRSLIRKFRLWQAEARQMAAHIIWEIQQQVLRACHALENGERQEFLNCLNLNAELLSKLTRESGVEIETHSLRQLGRMAREEGAAGKLSGAGGGDCGIAVYYDAGKGKKIMNKWLSVGIQPLDVYISSEGLRKKS